MATLVLSAAGNALAPGIGGVVGGLIGGWADNNLTFPLLFGRPSIAGPQINDLNFQTAQEGAGYYTLHGPYTRVAGNVRWQGKPNIVKTEQDTGKGGGGSTVVTSTYYLDVAVSIMRCFGRPIKRITRVWADTTLVYDRHAGGILNGCAVAFRPYLGTLTQAQDPVILAAEGADKTPAFRDRAGFVFEQFNITPYGRLPSFTAEVEADVQTSVATVCKRILMLSGIDESAIDVSRVPGCISGFYTYGIQTALAQIQPLISAYNLLIRQTMGRVEVLGRGGEDLVPINARDLGARAANDTAGPVVSIVDDGSYTQPRAVSLQFVDIDFDLQAGTVVNTIPDLVTNASDTSLTYTLTMDSAEADRISKTILYALQAERRRVSFTLPPSYMSLQEGDVVPLPVKGVTRLARVTKIDRGANKLLAVEGVLTQPHIYAERGLADPRTTDSSTNLNTLETIGYLLDIPALADADVIQPAIYAAAALKDSTASWPQAAAYLSRDNGATYKPIFGLPYEAGIGELVESLPGDVSDLVWDTQNTVLVKMYEGSLESVSTDAVLSGVNWAVVGTPSGWEIIGYANADLVSPNTYRLSNLIRGVRTSAILSHAAGASFIRLTSSGVVSQAVATVDIGKDFKYRLPLVGQNLLAADEQELLYQGVTVKNPPPAEFSAKRVPGGSRDVSLTWTRRSRSICAPFTTPGPEGAEQYVIDMYNNRTLKKSVTVTGVTHYDLSQADRDAAGLGSFRLTFKIQMVSPFAPTSFTATAVEELP